MDNTLSLGSVIPICVAIVATAGSFLNCVPLVKHPGVVLVWSCLICC